MDRPTDQEQLPPLPRVQLLDLSLDQLEQAERAVGLPVTRWQELPSRAALYRELLHVVLGIHRAELGRYTSRAVLEAVDLGAAEVGPSEADPT